MATGDWYSDLLVLRHASPESILWHCYHIVKRSLVYYICMEASCVEDADPEQQCCHGVT
jgi:hypothetical protein